MEIRLANLEDCQQVVSVLNEVTIHLSRKGIEQWNYPWDSSIIQTQIKSNCSYVLLKDGVVIGTFCISCIDHINDVTVPLHSKYLSQIAISPAYQGQNYGKQITDFACALAKNNNKTLYLDCWAGNDKLRDFYERNGFEYVGDFPEEDYYISIFKFGA